MIWSIWQLQLKWPNTPWNFLQPRSIDLSFVTQQNYGNYHDQQWCVNTPRNAEQRPDELVYSLTTVWMAWQLKTTMAQHSQQNAGEVWRVGLFLTPYDSWNIDLDDLANWTAFELHSPIPSNMHQKLDELNCNGPMHMLDQLSFFWQHAKIMATWLTRVHDKHSVVVSFSNSHFENHCRRLHFPPVMT